ncbi:2-amino-4-hydroxy-6-hydroxymethyldihydropteridine diphosphokinase [Pedobacter sandarakinus]|uniref:2-amino-4-hydroxy-6- hydroxymethyldihydropteridine diphosphokinase n=1 Tax=Pedobacter sandarakinus TaxID=353156 RepID=UPI002246F256|nr:2-amino-4-hydroxy-6-hydroxymethyldihydropteridine diphosphokinase [Pedobacter sandarakinus]MCX2574844.1 2-amino-4-hydroxy-6-hydroxymethyldihydropteridine diphosphokinase [Pedobacter sandarakinus]
MHNIALEYRTVYLLLGGNLGNRADNLAKAISLIRQSIGEIEKISACYETAAWGKMDQPAFLNQAIAVRTTLSPLEVLDQALNAEKVLGRIRKEKWGERLIDIDILLYENEIINIENRLTIPHPEMQHRKFVMIPLAEIAPDVIHPILQKTILSIAENINDILEVKRL